MYSITYRGADESLWNLAGPSRGHEGVSLVSLEELVGAVSMATTPGAGRLGVVRTGLITVPEMAGSFEVTLSGGDARPRRHNHEVARAFRRAWSQIRPGELTIRHSGSDPLRALVWLAEPLPPWSVDPYDRDTQRHSLSVPIVSDAGYWSGPPHRVEGDGTQVELYNPGDLEVWPVVSWSGEAVVQGPGVEPVTLPDAPSGATIDLDPATGSVITVDGEPAPELWSQLRGRIFPTGVPAGGVSTWTFSAGATVTMTPRVLDPWGW